MANCPICLNTLSEVERKHVMVVVIGKGPTCGPCADIVIDNEKTRIKMGTFRISLARARQFKNPGLKRQASGPYGSVKPILKRTSSYIGLSDVLKKNFYGSLKPGVKPPFRRTSSYINLSDILKE